MTITADNYQFISDLVRRKSALFLGDGKEYLVEARLSNFARDLGLSVDQYVAQKRVSLSMVESELIVEAMTTNETSWFRDSQPFTALSRHIVPEIQEARKPLMALRVWSAACSTGQEPYSIAMTLLDHFALQDGPTPVIDILATDLSVQVLDRAQQGKYSQLEVNRGLPATHLVKYFRRAGTEWQISDAIRKMVRFRQHNLLDLPPGSGMFDVVFLRNVLIYFDVATKLKVLKAVHNSLRPGGFLILGAAETTVGLDASWIRVPVGRSSVYQKAVAA